MRILRIQFENLNSLPRGDIDLEHGALAEAGIFAITGPTGAGKSTLLDALTLALYGRASRYGKTPNPENMMSRQSGSCQAEVLFEVPRGRFVARWELRRARNKPDGKLQAARRSVLEEGTGSVLAQKIDEADRIIEELTGLDYERFRRSVLLAQGEFGQFFKSKPQERAALLESLTGTIVYSELSRLAFREATDRENALAARREALGRVTLFTEEERAAKAGEIDALSARIAQLTAERAGAAAQVEAGRQLLARLGEEAGLAEREAALAREAEVAAPNRERLARHRQTEPFAAPLQTLDALKRQHAALLIQSGEAAAGAETARRELSAGLRAAQSVAASRVAEAEAAIASAREEVAKLDEGLAEAEKAEKAAEARVAEATHKLDQGLRGRTLEAAIQEFTKLEDRRNALLALRAAMEKRDATAAEAARLADDETALEADIETARREKDETSQEAEAQAKLLDSARVALEFEIRIADMADQRAELEDGKPCPLCGSPDHPFRRGGLLANSPIEEARRNLSAAQLANDTAAKEALLAAENLTRAEERFAGITKRRGELRWQQTSEHEAVERIARSVRIFTVDALEEAFAELEKTRADHEALTQSIRSAEAARNLAEKHLLSMQNRVIQLREKRVGIQNGLVALGDRLSALSQEAERLASPKWAEGLDLAAPDGRPLPRWRSLEEAREGLEALRSRHAEAGAKAQERQTQCDQLHKASAAQLVELTKLLAGSAFADVEALRAARLDPGEAAKIERWETAHTAQAQALGGQLRQVRDQIARLRSESRPPEGEALAALETQCRGLETEIAAATDLRAAVRADLERDREARQSLAEGLAELEKEEKSLTVWSRLRQMIGSASGNAFQEFAQGLSLDLLVRHANRHLTRLSDRYRLRRVEGGELTLEVIDLHQAGAIRPMASLSGGESFLASLALALGLSDLAGRNVRIDSLFIDEGFGSLDADTLDLAVSALDSLRLANKTVGVISHVELLKERIPVQIRVEKRLGGVSELRLPGDLAA